jgi:adenosylhomocysteine nucleosidase
VTRVLVVTGVELEARALARHLGLSAVAGAPWPHFTAGALTVACIGLRGSQLRARADRLAAFDVVLSAGTCGALDPKLDVGDLVVPEAVVDRRGGRWLAARLGPLARSGTLLSVDDVVATPAEKARLWLEIGAAAVDMESAAVLAWAVERGARGGVVRAVSDDAARAVPPALAAAIADDGRVRPLRAVTAALSRATTIGSLMELRAGTEAALRTVAAALARAVREA